MAANNGPTLAWIAGRPDAFTEKSHSFSAGAEVTKQIALLNDERSVQSFKVNWKVTVANAVVAQGADEGNLAVGETRILPVRFKIPGVNEKTDGEVRMEATIGKRKHVDRFTFRGFPVAQPAKGQVVVYDPVGKTSKLLTDMGVTFQAWDGRKSDQLLIVGREALGDDAAPPGDLEKFVREGGRLLMMQQQPDRLTIDRGLRVAGVQSRRVFESIQPIPCSPALDETDLQTGPAAARCWRPTRTTSTIRSSRNRLRPTRPTTAGVGARVARFRRRRSRSRTDPRGVRCSSASSTSPTRR
jgi:beta-galactosidase